MPHVTSTTILVRMEYWPSMSSSRRLGQADMVLTSIIFPWLMSDLNSVSITYKIKKFHIFFNIMFSFSSSDPGTENCALTNWNAVGMWNDVSCDYVSYPFVCEIPAGNETILQSVHMLG